jgi:hypothetical protein
MVDSYLGAKNNDVKIVTVIDGDTTLEGAFADVGDPISVIGKQKIRFFITVKAYNNSVNVRFLPLFLYEKAGTEFAPTNETAAGQALQLDAFLYYEENTDTNLKFEFEVSLNGTVGYVQLQMYAGTLGLVPGVIENITAIVV